MLPVTGSCRGVLILFTPTFVYHMFKLLALALALLCAGGSYAQGRCEKGNCRDGRGTLRFTDGALYRGQFADGLFEGEGSITYPNGSVYVGHFHRQLQDGHGILTDAAGNSYEGEWRGGQRNGWGKITYSDGAYLHTNWHNDSIIAEVTYTFANGDRYLGAMKNFELSGFGEMVYKNGERYRGEWRRNRPGGEGTMYYPNGMSVSGQWVNGRYSTDWDGLGYQSLDATEPVNCGEGCPDGPGQLRYTDGTTLVGLFVNGKPGKNTTVAFVDGRVYHGSYTNHRANGLGLMIHPDGRREGGLWQEGALYRSLYTVEAQPVAATKAESSEEDNEVKVWAVVVGCAFYQNMKALRYTDDDAYQVYAFLKSIEGGALSDQQVKVLIDERATRANILAAMEDTYRKADENDLILFYFSGHGLPGAFLPIDYDGVANALEHTEVHKALGQSRSRHKLVIADACHSGSLASRGGVADNRRALEEYYGALTDASASTALMMSSRGEEISMEDGGLRSGVFSHYLIKGLKGEADSNRDQLVSVKELFDYVYREVRGYTSNVQTPTLTGRFDARMPVSVVRPR